MSVELLAMLIVASFLGGGVFFGTARAGGDAWIAFTLGLLVYGLAMATGPGLFHH